MLFNAPLDLLIGCGGWSIPLILLSSYVTRWNPALLASAFYFLTVFCNNPHYMATIYRAYHTGTDFNQYRFFTIYVMRAHFKKDLATLREWLKEG